LVNFWSSNWIRIRNLEKFWIRIWICIKSVRIHNPAAWLSFVLDPVPFRQGSGFQFLTSAVNHFLKVRLSLQFFPKIRSHKEVAKQLESEVTKQLESRFFLLFFLDRRIRLRTSEKRIRIQEAQNHSSGSNTLFLTPFQIMNYLSGFFIIWTKMDLNVKTR
jgi:hypothetical protein